MNGPEHYREAERLLRDASCLGERGNRYYPEGDGQSSAIAAAQVHATLALAAATAGPFVEVSVGEAFSEDMRGWAVVTAPERVATP